MSRLPGGAGRDGRQDDDGDDASSHGSMPSLEPLATVGSRSAGSAGSARQGAAVGGGAGGGSHDESEEMLIDMIANCGLPRELIHGILSKDHSDDEDDDDDGGDDDDSDSSSSMPPLEDIAPDTKSQGNKRDRDGTSIRNKAEKPPPASLPLFPAAPSEGKKMGVTAASPFNFSVGTSTVAPPSAAARGPSYTARASSNPGPFNFTAGPLNSSSIQSKNDDDDPSPFSFSTGPISSSKKAAGGDTAGNNKKGGPKSSAFVFSPTSVVSPSSTSSPSLPSTGTNLAFHFNATSGSNENNAPRRIVRARRPLNAPSTTPSMSTNTARGTAANADTSASYNATSRSMSSTTTTATAAAPPSMPSSAMRTEVAPENSADRSPRASFLIDERIGNNSAGDRDDSGDAEREEDANADPNANAFSALVEDTEDDDDDDEDSRNSSLSDEISMPSLYDDDDEDDDDDPEDFPLRLLEDMLPPGMGTRVAARLRNGDGPGSRQQLSANIRPDDDDSVASSDDEDGIEAAKCCACYRRGDQSHKWKRLVTLPCCGLGGKEKSSSTRFCASCVLKLAVTRPESASSLGEYHFFEDECNEAPASHFYKENHQSDSKRFIECPRCRDILIVKLKNLKTSYTIDDDEDDDSASGECDCSECRAERRAKRETTKIKTASSISVHRATFKGKAWFVGRKRDNAMILWKAAHLHRSFIPLTALGGDKYRANVMKLAGWGILHKVRGKRNVDVYQMDRKEQIELVKLVSPNPITETDEEVNKEFDLFLELTHDMGLAGWESIKKFRIDRAIRLLNRFLYLMMYFRRYLPSPPLSFWQEWVVTALNAFNLALVIQFLLITAVYGGLFFGVGFVVCRALRNPKKFLSASRYMYVSAFLGAYLAYRFGKMVYYSPYITFLGFLSPKAIVPLKMILGVK